MISFTLLLMFSCNKDAVVETNTCKVSNPVENLPWLKSRINLILTSNPDVSKYQYISIAEYKGETVFIFGNCNPLVISDFQVYSCSNVFLGNVGVIPSNELLNRKTLWRTPNSLCSL
jgi:hypothetical protein